MYHRVQEEEAETSTLVVSPKEFEKQMKYLTENRYHIVYVDDLLLWMRTRKFIPSKTVAITLDDGYADIYPYVYSVLKKYTFPATIFLPINKVGTAGYLTWNQVQEMEKNGIRFGSHTLSHPSLPSIPLEMAKKEILESKKILEAKLKFPSTIFCYPYGRYTPTIRTLVKESGYSGAVAANATGETDLDDPFGFKRIRISYSARDSKVFWFELSGYYAIENQFRKKIQKIKQKIGISS